MTTYWLDGELESFYDNETLNESLNAQSVEDDVAVKCPWNQYRCIEIAKEVSVLSDIIVQRNYEKRAWIFQLSLSIESLQARNMQDARLTNITSNGKKSVWWFTNIEIICTYPDNSQKYIWCYQSSH